MSKDGVADARTAMDEARAKVMESENEIQKIKVALRSVAAAADESAASKNSLKVSALKVVGLPDAAKPTFKIQISSPVEELEITKMFDPLQSDAEGTFANFEAVDPAVATLTVSAFDADIPLGSSAGAADLAPLCEFDPLSPSKKVTQLDVPIVSEDGVTGSIEAKKEDEEAVAISDEKDGDGKAATGDDATKDSGEDEKPVETNEVESPRPVVFCGPSGVGKGTLIDMLMKRFPGDQFGFSVSHTTRAPREGEQDGVHYNFTTVDDIKKDIDAGKFIEYAEVHGKYYGTSVEAVESVKSSGKICVLDIDVQGAQSVKKSSLNPIYVFIAPPSMDELEKRLRGRGTESEEDMKKRLANAQGELDYGLEEGNFDRVFTNDDLEKTFEDLVAAFKGWYPHLVEEAKKIENEKETETKESDKGTDTKPLDSTTVQTSFCTVTLKVEYNPSTKDQRDKLYDLLNTASKRKAAAIDKLRKSAAEVSRATKTSPTKPSEASSSSSEKAVKSGFLNKKAKKKDSFLMRLYNKTIGPSSLLRTVFPVAKNYIIFFGAVTLMHFKGQELALPPPV